MKDTQYYVVHWQKEGRHFQANVEYEGLPSKLIHADEHIPRAEEIWETANNENLFEDVGEHNYTQIVEITQNHKNNNFRGGACSVLFGCDVINGSIKGHRWDGVGLNYEPPKGENE